MEWKKSMQVFSLALIWMVVVLSQISAFPTSQQASSALGAAYSPEDYEQPGLREMLEELDRQGGLSGRMVPRSYFNVQPNHKMARKSQRSNTLRLRFGKRSEGIEDRSSVMGAENPIPWKMTEDGTTIV